MKKNIKKQSGFTIIELMIATTIFSLVLIIALAAILQITRMYHQGTLQARTQNRVREIVDSVADEIRYQPGEIIVTTGPTKLGGVIENDDGSVGSVDPTRPQDYNGQYCIGNTRYRYLLGYRVDPNATEAASTSDDRSTRRALITESLPGGCNDILTQYNEVADVFIRPNTNQLENELDDNMRILEFSIQQLAQSYYVSVTLAYGDDDLIGYENGNHSCKPGNVASAYCAVARLEVVVNSRFER